MINKVAKGWTYQKLVSYSFLAGLICMGAIHSLIQDWYGMEVYIQHCRESWISGWYTAPIAIVVFSLGVVWQISAKIIASRCDKLSEKDE
jgi:hypothetical protein